MEMEKITLDSLITKTIGALHPNWFVKFYNEVVDRVKLLQNEYPAIDLNYYITCNNFNKINEPQFQVSSSRDIDKELQIKLQRILWEVEAILRKEHENKHHDREI